MADPGPHPHPWEVIACPHDKRGPMVYIRVIAGAYYLNEDQARQFIAELDQATSQISQEV